MATTRRPAAGDIAFFVTLLAIALALGGALAHAFELPNKMAMTGDDYFVVQQIYRGWNRLAYVLAVEFFGILAVIFLYRHDRNVLRPAIAGLICLVATQAVFWIWTFPANSATANWTALPADWELLRWQWEYSHLAGAVLQTFVMVFLIIAVLRRRHRSAMHARENPSP